MITISNFEERRNTVGGLIELLEKNIISDADKIKIYDVIMSMNKKTDKQKDRFARYFGIKPDNLKRETMANIAKSYGCTASAIRSSVISVRAGLYRIPKENFLILNDIYQKY